jgi:cell division transport system permease protein
MIKFYFSEAFKSLKYGKMTTVLSFFTLSLAIFSMTITFYLWFFSNTLENELKNKFSVSVFLADSINGYHKQNIKNQILEYKFVRSIEYISKETARRIFVNETGNDFEAILKYNPLPASFRIRINKNLMPTELKKFESELLKIFGVEEVVIDYSLFYSIVNLLFSVKIFIYSIGFIFSVISFYLVYSNSKYYLLSRKKEIDIMKLVGAKISTIRLPLIIRGLILGVLSSMLVILIFNLIIITLHKIYPQIKLVATFYLFNFVPLIFGILLGFSGSGFLAKEINLIITKNKK